MNCTILNRDFAHPADGWYQIEPKGTHPNRAAGVVQVIDDTAAASIVNRFNKDAQAGSLRHGHEMLIDHEHFKDDTDKETRAYGWLQELENRDDGVYGRIRWTSTGKAAVDGGDYRFFSTEYAPEDLKILNAEKGGTAPRRVRPLRLDGLTLTNMNNNRGQKPITNRGPTGPADNNQQKKNMKTIATKLGLSAEASEDAILAEVTKLFNRVELSEKDLPTLKNRVTELETSNKTLLDEQIDALLDGYVGAENKKLDDKTRNRLKPVLAGLKNREERTATLADFGFKIVEPAKADKTTQSRVLNRGNGHTDAAADTAAGDDQAAITKIRNRAAELKKGGLSFDASWAQAVSENNTAK